MIMNEGPKTNQDLDDQSRLNLLRQEADHFFQAELYHDQRASWLLALASGLLTVVLGAMLAVNDGKLAKSGRPLMIIAAACFGAAIVLGLFTLWPISGRAGHLWNPFKRRGSHVGSGVCDLTVESHYHAHRQRAASKANRIVLVIICLMAGVLSALGGIVLALTCQG
jgi:hypothetical protein